jgi:hypothetical protein
MRSAAPAEVAVAHGLALARRGEARGGVLPYRLEQPEARLAVLLPHLRERLLHQPAERAGDRRARQRVAGAARAHRLRGVERERAAERGQAGQQGALGVAQQGMAPVEERAERAVAGQRRAAPAREDGERVVEPRRELLDAQRREGRGGQFEGERQAVEPGADGGHRQGVRVGEREVARRAARALDEQLDGFVGTERLRVERRVGRVASARPGRGGHRYRRSAERRDGPRDLALDGQRLSARGEHRQPGRAAQ